mmetsp:Transcript_16850/g.64174  ORF Transcript_16850/g.64174 Transcript_16850/m.64174 type:complete len:295 (+) Transcript_16850:401-1285(+)
MTFTSLCMASSTYKQSRHEPKPKAGLLAGAATVYLGAHVRGEVLDLFLRQGLDVRHQILLHGFLLLVLLLRERRPEILDLAPQLTHVRPRLHLHLAAVRQSHADHTVDRRQFAVVRGLAQDVLFLVPPARQLGDGVEALGEADAILRILEHVASHLQLEHHLSQLRPRAHHRGGDLGNRAQQAQNRGPDALLHRRRALHHKLSYELIRRDFHDHIEVRVRVHVGCGVAERRDEGILRPARELAFVTVVAGAVLWRNAQRERSLPPKPARRRRQLTEPHAGRQPPRARRRRGRRP